MEERKKRNYCMRNNTGRVLNVVAHISIDNRNYTKCRSSFNHEPINWWTMKKKRDVARFFEPRFGRPYVAARSDFGWCRAGSVPSKCGGKGRTGEEEEEEDEDRRPNRKAGLSWARLGLACVRVYRMSNNREFRGYIGLFRK